MQTAPSSRLSRGLRSRLSGPAALLNAGPALALALAALILYTLTLAPTVAGTDAGELVLAAHSGGVAHAPGFPTWLLAAGQAVRLPLREPAWRLNFFSALMAAATLVGLWFWLLPLPRPLPAPAATAGAKSKGAGRRPAASGPARASAGPPARSLTGALSSPSARSLTGALSNPSARSLTGALSNPSARSLTLAVLGVGAVGRSFWPWATTTEVYSLNTCLLAVCLACLFGWSQRLRAGEAGGGLLLPLAALAYGLALGAHLATTALLAPAIALWLLWHRRALSPRLVAISTLALWLGLSTYALLPLRAAADPILNWGDPDTLRRFWRHVTAAQYRSNISLAPASLATELRFGLSLTFWQYSPLALPFIAWGLWWGWKQQRRLTLFLLLAAGAGLVYAILYAIEDDQDAYYILPHLLLLVPLLWGLHLGLLALAHRLGQVRPGQSRPGQSRPGQIAAVLLPWLLALLALAGNRPLADRSHYWYHRDYFANLTADIAPGGAIFTRDWQFYSPSLYFQRLLGQRPDLRVIDVELMRRDWYLNALADWYPDLIGPAGPQLAVYRQQRNAWEQNPRQFESDPTRVASLQNAYIAAIDALIAAAETQPGGAWLGPDMEQGIGAGYDWKPIGLSFRLDAPTAAAGPLPAPTWNLENLVGQWRRLPDDPARKVAQAHALMLTNRAIYLARAGDQPGADAALRLAAQIDPESRRQID